MRFFSTLSKLSFVITITVMLLSPNISIAKPLHYPFEGTVLDRDNPRPDLPPFYTEPYAPTLEERMQIAIEYTADNRGGWDGAIAKAILERDNAAIDDATVQKMADRLAGREDCADFTAIRIITTMFVHKEKPFLTDEQYDTLKQSLLHFKYWFDEPGFDNMLTWTENHQILFHATEYLAGQLFTDEVFTNNGENGKWHMEHARPKIMKWMQRRARWGFSEWDSNVYYSEDLGGTINLAQYADDEEIATAAAIVTDLMFFDMVVDVQNGVYGTSHGRTYAKDVMTGRDDSTSDILTIITGIGQFRGAGGMENIPLVASNRYTVPDAIVSIGQDDPEELINYERHGIPLDKITDYGLSFNSEEDLAPLFAMGIYAQPQIIDMFIRCADKYEWWDQPFLEDIGDQHKMLPRNGTAGSMRGTMDVESDRTLLGEVNKVTYRTPDYMLSSALDYMAGGRGNQQHVWQGTLSPEAIVFTTNPGTLKLHSRTPCYWGGQNRFPRIAQFKNLAVILYDINTKKALGERQVFEYTHAFFPAWAFDEVVEENNWIIGRRHNGYIALYSALPYEWQNPDDPFKHDVHANGLRQIWIAQMGSKAQYGSFEDFKKAVLSADLKADVETLSVNYNAPGLGEATFAWTGPFTVAGEEVPMRNFKLFENPYGTSEFDSGHLEIQHEGKKLTLDFRNMVRKGDF